MHRVRKILAQEASKRESKRQRVQKRPKVRKGTIRRLDKYRPRAIHTDLDMKVCEIQFKRATEEAKNYWRLQNQDTTGLVYSLQRTLHMKGDGQHVEAEAEAETECSTSVSTVAKQGESKTKASRR